MTRTKNVFPTEGGEAVTVSESSNCPKDAEGTAVSESSSFTDADSNAALRASRATLTKPESKRSSLKTYPR